MEISPWSLKNKSLKILTTIAPPQAFIVRFKSSSGTRPAQNIPRSAKYCVATSPIGSLDKTTYNLKNYY